MLMKVFSVTVPNPYIGEGSKNADRTAPAGETTLSYFTVFAKDFEGAVSLRYWLRPPQPTSWFRSEFPWIASVV